MTSKSVFNATLKPYAGFNVNNDVTTLCNALKSGPDDAAIIAVLCKRTSDQRTEIFTVYFQRTGRYLIQDIKTNYNFSLYLLFAGLSVPYYEYVARCIHRRGSMRWLFFILFTLSNEEIANMKEYFEAKYNQDLDTFIRQCIRQYNKNAERDLLKPIIRSLFSRRNENLLVSPPDVNYDIGRIAGINPGFFSSKKNEKLILKEIFHSKNWSHIRAVCEEYQKKYNHPVFDVFKRCYWTFNDCDIFSNMAKYALNKDYYFAYLLKVSMKGLGTNDLLLMHIIIKRAEIDLGDIKAEFQNLYNQTLREWVQDDTSGSYRTGLLALMGEQSSS